MSRLVRSEKDVLRKTSQQWPEWAPISKYSQRDPLRLWIVLVLWIKLSTIKGSLTITQFCASILGVDNWGRCLTTNGPKFDYFQSQNIKSHIIMSKLSLFRVWRLFTSLKKHASKNDRFQFMLQRDNHQNFWRVFLLENSSICKGGITNSFYSNSFGRYCEICGKKKQEFAKKCKNATLYKN